MRLRSPLLGAAAACALFLVGALVSCGGGSGEPSEDGLVSEPAQHERRSITEASVIRRRFPVFRTPAEGLPAKVTRILGSRIYGLDYERAQSLPSPTTSIELWATPGEQKICLFSFQRGILGNTCSSVAGALNHGVAITLLENAQTGAAGPRRTIVGIAPESTCLVVAKGPAGSTRQIYADDGVFAYWDRLDIPPDRFYTETSCPASSSN